MIWLIFLVGGVYTLTLVALGFWLSSKWYQHNQGETARLHSQSIKYPNPASQKMSQNLSLSGPLKSITPLERSLEDSKQIRERIEQLLQ